MKKKMVAAILALVMIVSSFAGCSASDSETQTQTQGNEAQETTEASEETQSEEGGATLPITEEKVTLTFWMKNDATMMNVTDGDMNNAPFYQELEERTNVHIEWIVPAAGTEAEQFNLMVASGELPDIMYFNNDFYPAGLDAAVEDGYLLDLTDLLPEYAPDYLNVASQLSENTQKDLTTAEGRYVEVANLNKKRTLGGTRWMGYMIRQDWLDEYGLETPVTYDDWENVLTVFKENGAQAPLALLGLNLFGLGAGMGVYGNNCYDFYQIDGDVGFALYDDTEATYEYLTMLNRWYENGLIDPDFASSTSWISGDMNLVTTGASGIFEAMYTMPDSQYYPAMEEGVEFSALIQPRESTNDVIKYSALLSDERGKGCVISADCEHPDIALKWLNYLFTEEGSMFASYGIEGDTYTLDENGDPVFTEKVSNNPDGYNMAECMKLYMLGPGITAGAVESEREVQLLPEEAVDYAITWTEFVTTDYVYPKNATMNEEENDEFTKIMADLETFVYENVIAFVTGTKSLDEYDEFVQAIKDKGIERCIELKQTALDRYNSK